jgi:Cof subfamily protein (haloacid dehalogenase superfamily)
LPIKLIAVDLDSTLLKDNKTISKYTQSILKRCQQQGIKVAFATARSYSTTEQYVPIVMPDAVISSAGARVCIDGKIIHQILINAQTVRELYKILLKSPHVRYRTIESIHGFYISSDIDSTEPLWAAYLPPNYTVISENGGDNTTHIDSFSFHAYFIDAAISDRATLERITSSFPAIDVIPFSGEHWYRFIGKGASKWNRVRILADYYKINTADIASFGDDFSDIEMIKNSGIGIAMENAIVQCKDVADYICDLSDNDGVAKWLERHFLLEA